MCRNLTREQRIEGWRAVAELLGGLAPRGIGALAAALAARLRRRMAAAAVDRVEPTTIAR